MTLRFVAAFPSQVAVWRESPMSTVPRKEDMYNPLLQALRELGGSGTNEEIADRVITILNVPDDVASELHDPENSNETELEYRLAWARTYL
jgi:restriction system protein